MTVVLVGLVVVLIIAVGVVGYLLLQKPAAAVASPQGPAYDPNVLVGMTRQEMEDLLKEQQRLAEENKVIVSMPSILVFQDGGVAGKINIENVKENKFPFTIEILLDESNKSVFKSGLIPVGSLLETAALTEKLDKGTYEASVIYTNYEEDTGLERGKVGVAVTLRVDS